MKPITHVAEEPPSPKKKGTTYDELLKTTMKLRDVAVKDAEAQRKAKKEYAISLQHSCAHLHVGTCPTHPTT